MNRVKKEECNQGDLSSSGLRLPLKSERATKEIEIIPPNETGENTREKSTTSREPNVIVEIPIRKETRVRYKRNSTKGSKGSIQEEIRIYDNPFTSYYPADGQEGDNLRCFREKRGVSFYVKDAFCPIRRTCTTAICCISAMILILFISLIFNTSQIHTSKKNGPRICLTQECVKTAAFLLTGMDQSVDPCDDFFEYACGMWNKIHVIPEDRSSITTFEVLADQLQHVLRRLLEEPINNRDNSATRKAKMVYKSCINTSEIKLNGEKRMKELVNSFGGWPVADKRWTSRANFSMEELLGQLKKELNEGILFEVWVGPDDKNSSLHVIQMDQLQLGLPGRDYFLKNTSDGTLTAYYNYMVTVATLYGADQQDAVKEMKDVLDFEIRLASITVPETDRQDTSEIYTKLTLSELKTKVPEINWSQYFYQILFTMLKDDEPIVFYSLPYYIKLNKVLATTNHRVVQNYAIWRLLMNNILPHMTNGYQQACLAFKKVLLGISSERNRWSQCVEWTNKRLGMAVGALFIQENFNPDSKESAVEMIRNIREAFNELLDENEWMDEETKKLAREKAEAMNERIGYPEILTQFEELDVEYQKLNVTHQHFFRNMFNVLQFECSRNMDKLRKPVDRDKWTTEPAVVNAFYSPNKNDIVFPAGILQPFFYSKYFPKSVNYGGIGVVIGHEMTHGFDDRGRLFDKSGNMKEWWNNATIQAFKKQIQCIINQYSDYKIDEINLYLNGHLTVGENIADNGGLKQSFRAYQKYVERFGDEPLLPGLNLTHEQLFFLNYGQIWCGSMRPEEALAKLRSSSHSPGKFRVIGPLSNSHDFAKAFDCPPNTRMNPTKKCVVW
ncbi:neprilysin-1 isoform X2 [Planococcus citri]|uniref:neprilysin-1 isoform X2 n=1 Tax=Planococcus citri TaxID=170843 RepID=UPI0031F7A4E2